MSGNFQQQARQPGDGQVAVQAMGNGRLALCVDDADGNFAVFMSEHNAARVVALLATYLRIRLNPKDANNIK